MVEDTPATRFLKQVLRCRRKGFTARYREIPGHSKRDRQKIAIKDLLCRGLCATVSPVARNDRNEDQRDEDQHQQPNPK